jgi:hypothetical protein
VRSSKSSEMPDASDGDGLAEKLLGLDGLRLIAVVEAEPTTSVVAQGWAAGRTVVASDCRGQCVRCDGESAPGRLIGGDLVVAAAQTSDAVSGQAAMSRVSGVGLG